MADRIDIDTQTLEELSAYFSKLSNQLAEINGSMGSAISYARRVGPENGDIVSRLNNARRQLQSSVSHASKVSRNTMTAASMWVSTENGIVSKLPGGNTPEAMRGETGDADEAGGIIKLLKDYLGKVFEKAGVFGKTGSTIWKFMKDLAAGTLTIGGLGKYLIEGKKLLSKWADLNSRYKRLSNLGKDYAKKLGLKEMFGLDKFWKNSSKDAARHLSGAKKGLDRFKANFDKQFKSGMSNVAAWITGGITSAINNYTEHKEGLKTGAVGVDRVAVEWAVETAGHVAVGAGATALAAAGLAAVGFAGAPVVVVAGAAVAITWAADGLCKWITGTDKGIAETVGDAAGWVWDNALKPAAGAIVDGVKNGINSVSNWLSNKVSTAWGHIFA